MNPIYDSNYYNRNDMDPNFLRGERFQMDYPYAPNESRFYDGQTHTIMPQRLFRVTLPNGKEGYILQYIEDQGMMITLVELEGNHLVKVPLDNAGYNILNIGDLIRQGVDCSNRLEALDRRIFSKPITNIWNYLSPKEKPKEEDNTEVRVAGSSAPPPTPPTVPPIEPNIEEQPRRYKEAPDAPPVSFIVENKKTEKSKIGVFVDEENRWFIGDYLYNIIFHQDRTDVTYLPLSQHVVGFEGYTLLSEEEIKELNNNYSVFKMIINRLPILSDGENIFLDNNQYQLVFGRKTEPTEDGRKQLSAQEREFIDTYYAQSREFIMKPIQVEDSPEAILYQSHFYVRPDVATGYGLYGVSVNLQYSDDTGNTVEKVYVDVPDHELQRSDLVKDVNQHRSVFYPSTMTIDSKRPVYLSTVTDQNDRKYHISNQHTLERIGLLDFATKKMVIVDEEVGPETKWALEVDPFSEKMYKLSSKDVYPLFVDSKEKIIVPDQDTYGTIREK